jgi:dTDP-4-dehydrorhamnose reductase
MSKPDDCEVYQELAFNVNVTGTKNILLAAEKGKSFIIFISTDFIFDGEQGIYKEEDESHPVNYYGETKVHAEELVKKYNYAFAIIRTILVYGKPLSGKNNILTIVKEKLEKGEKYKVVNDQVRTPTYVEDLASAIITVIEKKATGIYHIGGKDVLTPYEMACKTADYLGLDKSLIRKVTQADFSQPAQRPLKTGFNISKAETELGYRPVSFEEGLRKTFS